MESNLPALSNDACFAQQRPSWSYYINVSSFVLHTCDEAQFRFLNQMPLQETVTQWYKHCVHCRCYSILSNKFSQFNTPQLWFMLFLLSLAVSCLCCFALWLFSQCCNRKLVAMLMSLFDTRRASRASVLEKPISTNLATCRAGWGDRWQLAKTAAD